MKTRRQVKFSDPERVFKYEYRVENNSVLNPWFRRIVCQRVLRWVPRHLHPNLLSLTGNMFAFLVFGALMLGWISAEVAETHPWGAWIFFLPAIGLFIYTTLDNTDGLQARRTKTSSPLGEFMDHWFDAFAVFMLPLGVIMAIDIPATHAMPVIITGMIACWATYWEQRKSGVLRLPALGEVEGNLMAIGFYLVSAILGTAIWQGELFGVSYLDMIVWLTVFGFSYAAIKLLIVNRGERARVDILGITVCLGLLGLYALLAHGRVAGEFVVLQRLIYLVIGLWAVKHVGDLQRSHLIGTKYRAVDFHLLAAALLLNASLFLGPAFLQAEVQIGLLVACAVLGVAKLLHQFAHTVSYVPKKLGVKVLRLTAEQKEQVAQA